jgi:hypothetical protein
VKDSQYPEKRIVGWYHSHPGFGIFLSEHDLFIHKNFFSDPNQVAWVFDPHSDEEGCFVWEDREIVRLRCLEVQNQAVHGVESPHPRREALREDAKSASDDSTGRLPSRLRPFPRIVKWSILTFSHLLVLALGFFVALLLFGPRVIYVPVPEGMTVSPVQRPDPQPPVDRQPPADKEKGK